MVHALFFLRPEWNPNPPIVDIVLSESYGDSALDAHRSLLDMFERLEDNAVVLDSMGLEWPMALYSLHSFATYDSRQ